MKNALGYGFALGCACCAWTLAEDALGIHSTRLELLHASGYLAIVLPLVFIVLAVRNEQLKQPTASLAWCVLVAAITMLMSDAVALPFLWVHRHFIAPDWPQHLVAFERQRMLLAGASPSQISRRLTAIAISQSFGAQLAGSILSALVLAPLVALPTAIVQRKQRPVAGAA